MSVQVVPFPALQDRLEQFSCIIDTRSPAEFADDHLPGAINLPVLDDRQRAEVGTLYTQSSPFAARRLGAAAVARNIALHLEGPLKDCPKDWAPLIYCWRGGERSASMAHVLSRVGWRTTQLQGGYKGYRRAVIEGLDLIGARLDYRVLCGPTGSGKSRLLAALRRRGAQVLDLEGFALHRGSVLGRWPDERAQPGQRAFESSLWQALQSMDPAKPVYVEAESRKIGDLRIPLKLSDALRTARCICVELGDEHRVRLLLEEYAHLFDQPDTLKTRLRYLTARHGRTTVASWEALVESGAWAELARTLLAMHYDPAYRHSISQHFVHYAKAMRIRLATGDEAAVDAAAGQILDFDGVASRTARPAGEGSSRAAQDDGCASRVGASERPGAGLGPAGID